MARLDEMEAELERIAQRSAFELDLVRAAKTLKRDGRDQRVDVVVRDGSGSVGIVEVKSSRGRSGNGRSNKSGPIRRILESDPDRFWKAGEISAKLAEQGIELSRDATRVTMNRMGNELEKRHDGAFRLARRQGSFDQPSANGGDPAAEDRETGLEAGTRQGVG